jgi:hypothetical protein
MLVDQKTEGVVVPLNHALTEAKGKLELANSEYHIFVRDVCLIFLDRFTQRDGRTWRKTVFSFLVSV